MQDIPNETLYKSLIFQPDYQQFLFFLNPLKEVSTYNSGSFKLQSALIVRIEVGILSQGRYGDVAKFVLLDLLVLSTVACYLLATFKWAAHPIRLTTLSINSQLILCSRRFHASLEDHSQKYEPDPLSQDLVTLTQSEV